ncbi:MAG: cyclic nucleotide-binding domain-containing protein [Mariprofundaceae bacterium]|nr:cyclic nucleotide-binding domain-containing protein [Mariprofundaceae bacterium]
MPVDMTWLENNLFHHTLTFAEKSTLKSLIQIKTYAKGDIIIQENRDVNGVFVLKFGSVALEHQKHAQTVRIATLQSGAQLGDMSLFNGEQASVTVKALETCEVYHLPHASMRYMMEYRQNLSQDIMRNTIRNLSKAIRQMNDNQAYAQQYMQGVRA